jgi:hypothetical protein
LVGPEKSPLALPLPDTSAVITIFAPAGMSALQVNGSAARSKGGKLTMPLEVTAPENDSSMLYGPGGKPVLSKSISQFRKTLPLSKEKPFDEDQVSWVSVFVRVIVAELLRPTVKSSPKPAGILKGEFIPPSDESERVLVPDCWDQAVVDKLVVIRTNIIKTVNSLFVVPI